MKSNLILFILSFGAAASIAQERPCAMSDADLLECPAVEAPRVTELKGGLVELSFTVQPDGSVGDLQVVDSAGDERWIDAATETVSRWEYRATGEAVAKIQRFSFEFTDSFCSQSFSPINVVEFLKGSPDSEVALAARRKGDEITAYGIYNVDGANHLTSAGVQNADILVSVCGVPITDVFSGDRDSYWETSFCCDSESEEPALVFERESNGQTIKVPFP
jgi:TonB family protein